MRSPGRSSGLASLALLVALAGCTSGEIAEVPDPVDPNSDLPVGDDDLNPGGGDPSAPKPLVYSGKYELTSIVDLAGSGIFGEKISGTLVQLSLFHEHPAATILNLMAIYEVPYYTQVWNVIPGFLKDLVTNELDKLIVEHVFGNVRAIDEAVQIVDDVASVSRNVELVTHMTLRGPIGDNQMRGDHIMKGLGFRLWSWNATIPIPTEFAQIAQLEVRASLTPRDLPDGKGALLDLGKQNFAIPYGAMLMDALKQAVFMPKGATTLGQYLNKIFDCQEIAEALGDLCVLGACLDDAVSVSDMAGFCRSGFSTLGLVVEAAVRSLKFDLVDLNNGKCVMYDKGYDDTRGDGKMDAISDGEWDMMIKVGGTAKTTKSPFDGRRIADM
jgi:hypothetical protein